jgi:hypothetical protein
MLPPTEVRFVQSVRLEQLPADPWALLNAHIVPLGHLEIRPQARALRAQATPILQTSKAHHARHAVPTAAAAAVRRRALATLGTARRMRE